MSEFTSEVSPNHKEKILSVSLRQPVLSYFRGELLGALAELQNQEGSSNQKLIDTRRINLLLNRFQSSDGSYTQGREGKLTVGLSQEDMELIRRIRGIAGPISGKVHSELTGEIEDAFRVARIKTFIKNIFFK